MIHSSFEFWVADRWKRQGSKVVRPEGVPYPLTAALGLPGEVGEVLELLKKHFRDGKHPGTDLAYELGDVLHYLIVIAQSYDLTLHQLMFLNRSKLEQRDAEKRAVTESIIAEMNQED